MARARAGIGRKLQGLAGVLVMLGVAAGASADERALVAAARAVLAKHQDALVTVRLTAKVRRVYQGQERAGRETTSEISGTVLTPSGLTVVSAASGDPSGPGASGGAGSETDITDTKLVLRDGRELAARFVLRDRDLDLAFVMPEEQGLSLPYVAFDAGATLAPLDDIIHIYPLGKAHGREVAVALGMVQAVLTKPRRLMAVDLVTGLRSMGCPAFSATGQIVGLVVLKPAGEQAASGEGLRAMLDLIQPVIVPAETVRELAQQASAKPSQP
jgi:S1-C subfamily serine protease